MNKSSGIVVVVVVVVVPTFCNSLSLSLSLALSLSLSHTHTHNIYTHTAEADYKQSRESLQTSDTYALWIRSVIAQIKQHLQTLQELPQANNIVYE
jgi:hypothetical protein